jgi:methyltransferase family protein
VIEQNVSPSTLSGQAASNPSVRQSEAPPIGVPLPSLLDEAWRLEAFAHPFTFSAFFSPEDTLLCVCAADAARQHLPDTRVAELTSGSGLVGFYLLRQDDGARLLGLDVDAEAARVAEGNAQLLGLADRARFVQSDLWSASTLELLEAANPQLLVCNPPYVPEPPGTSMQIEAGAGPHGTAHLLRALELTRLIQPQALALSWCSLSDPAAIVAAAEGSGYELHTLYVTAIADGEYSGSVHSYLRTLSDCFISEQRGTLGILAPDGSARFGYLLFAGAFRRSKSGRQPGDGGGASTSVAAICEHFSRGGIQNLAAVDPPFTLHRSVLTRWDELRLRVLLHGEIEQSTQESA